MSNQHSNSDGHQHHESWLFSRNGIATIGMLAVLSFLVYTGHSAHLLGVLPYLLILACPLMHIFMHGGHHHHHSGNESEKSESHSHGGGCCGGGDNNKQTDKKPSSSSTQGE
jgi:hypothetical protein